MIIILCLQYKSKQFKLKVKDSRFCLLIGQDALRITRFEKVDSALS